MKYILIGCYDIRDYYNSDLFTLGFLNLDHWHNDRIKIYLDGMLGLERDNVKIVSVRDTVFNIFGHYIMQGKVKPEDIRVVLFEENHKQRECGYDKNGFLTNWPIGFFEWRD